MGNLVHNTVSIFTSRKEFEERKKQDYDYWIKRLNIWSDGLYGLSVDEISEDGQTKVVLSYSQSGFVDLRSPAKLSAVTGWKIHHAFDSKELCAEGNLTYEKGRITQDNWYPSDDCCMYCIKMMPGDPSRLPRKEDFEGVPEWLGGSFSPNKEGV